MISVLCGVVAFLVVGQTGGDFGTKVFAIITTAAIGLLLVLLSKRMGQQRIALNDALFNAHHLLFKDETATSFDPIKAADLLTNQLKLTAERERLTFEYGDCFVFKLDKDARIVNLNRYPEYFMGYNRKSLVGASLLNLSTPGSAPSIQEALQRCRESQQTTVVEMELRTHDGNPIDLSCTIEWSQRAAAFYCVAQDITDRKQIERYRAEVTAMLGHDLRAPLTSLTLLLDNVGHKIYGEIPARLQDALERAQQSTGALVSMINRLLEADKVEAGQLKNKAALFSCEDLLSDAVEVVRELSSSKDISIECKSDDIDAFADYNHCFQIVSNLVSNAIKFSPGNSVIRVRCTSDAAKVLIQVSDEGPGIPLELKDSLFDRYKSKATGNEGVASSGLGLFIARKLARLQGGDLGFKPNEDGPGTTFWLALPVFVGQSQDNKQSSTDSGWLPEPD